ncbi:hypothetical protein DCAR_0207197 [Daucus carota subsp. sativus]|uniref:tRNA-intron lyase n=1 Tax=Daucus carota subsp. sativus TaxID=79200 RepID=A0A166DQJ5_DAUCS|nr:PREDICTED: tRNA-splicing endonuclease subunit Sen2-1-like [Daucus carota subsp. sativus]WOG87964.1 hypothetical protein DCAR_0207197 [Daucus carota subsp. sativus]
MGPRWKGKEAEAKALADPITKIVSQLQSSLVHSDSQGILSGCSVLLAVDAEQTKLLNHTCFGVPIITAEKDKQWFQLSLEEAFYLCNSLNCLKVVGEGNLVKGNNQLWSYMVSKKKTFPAFYKAYSHLRMKNWVVRSGSQYGVDFVAYRHHPSLVHADYAVLVSAELEGNGSGRLKVWSDMHCTLRLCGGVAKTLLVLHVTDNSKIQTSPLCLESYLVEERTITRWIPEQCREDQKQVQKWTL